MRLVAAAMNDTDPVTKVTILQAARPCTGLHRGHAATEDRYSMSRNQLLDQMAYAMGGRVLPKRSCSTTDHRCFQ